ncbi:MAG: hypothetical protein AAGG75_21985 [Bacteroidota bacterium]
MDWEAWGAWLRSFGEAYGVNPFVFALLYFGTIPLSLFSFSMMVRNYRLGRSLFWPIAGAFLCFIGTYVYLFIAGRNIPLWVYGLVVLMMSYSGWQIYQRIQRLRGS